MIFCVLKSENKSIILFFNGLVFFKFIVECYGYIKINIFS